MELTDLTKEEAVSTIKSLLAPSELAAPGSGSVKEASFPATSLITAVFRGIKAIPESPSAT